MGSIKDGILSQLDFSGAASPGAAVGVLLDALPDPDTTSTSGAIQGIAGYFDEMSPMAVAELRVELLALQTAVLAGGDDYAAVYDDDVVPVVNSAGADSHNAVALVDGGALTHVQFAATIGIVDDADVIAVVNSAGADSHNATANVAVGVVTNVELAATVAMVDHEDSIDGYVLSVVAGALDSIDHTDVWASGTYVADSDDQTADSATIDTGITTAVSLATLIVSIERAGASVKADAIVTDNDDGTFTITEDTTYSVTDGDSITWFAEAA